MSEVYLAHHGILGQKWGVRRFQNEDGSLTQSGKKRYSYTSEKTLKLKNSGNKAAYNKSRELDQKISKKNAELTTGEKFVRALLVGPYSARLTYDIARESGYSKGRSWLKARLDLSVPGFVSGMASASVQGAISSKAKTEKGQTISGLAGTATMYGVDRAIASGGSELSLRQHSLRNKYIAGNTPNEKRKRKESGE